MARIKRATTVMNSELNNNVMARLVRAIHVFLHFPKKPR
jgi:hypothetical protein